jgi:hypothetical protein
MNDQSFRKKFKPAVCLNDPVMNLISKDKYHEMLNIVRRSYREKGMTYDSSCPKRFTCQGICQGRPIDHWISELKPYIKKISHLLAEDGNLYVKTCGTCPISKTCKSTCNQVSDYMIREKNSEDLSYKVDTEFTNFDISLSTWVSDDDFSSGILKELIERYGSIQDAISNLPWDAVNNKRQRLVRAYTLESKDFAQCAKEIGYANGTVARNEFYCALTALSKYASVRYYMECNRDVISDFDYELLRLRYYDFLTLKEISERLNIKLGTIRSRIFRFIKRNKLKYSNYLNKNKIIPSNIF